MKRDPDYIRQLLLDFEDNDEWIIFHGPDMEMDMESDAKEYHIQLMCDQGLLVPLSQKSQNSYRMTSYAHDFLDAVRDKSTWDTAKSTASKAGGFTLNILFEISRDIINQKLREIIGY